jgi:hypothetical protein
MKKSKKKKIKNDNNQTHQSFKCTLKKAINDTTNLKRLNEHVLVINDITSRAYQFIKIVQLLNYDKTGSLKNWYGDEYVLNEFKDALILKSQLDKFSNLIDNFKLIELNTKISNLSDKIKNNIINLESKIKLENFNNDYLISELKDELDLKLKIENVLKINSYEENILDKTNYNIKKLESKSNNIFNLDIKYNKDLIKDCVLLSAGLQVKNQELTDIYRKYFNEYKNLYEPYLSYPLRYTIIEIETCLKNNIIAHFKEYINRYINCVFIGKDMKKISDLKLQKKTLKSENESNLDSIKDKIKNINLEMKLLNEKIKEKRKDLINLKVDIYSNSTKEYNGIHKEWLKNNRKFIVPNLLKDNINYHLEADPYKFINYSIFLIKQIEKMGFKSYQVFPQRNGNVPSSMKFDTVGLVYTLKDTIIKKFKEEYIKKSAIIFNNYLDINNKSDIITKELSDKEIISILQQKIIGYNKTTLKYVNKENYIEEFKNKLNKLLTLDFIAQNAIIFRDDIFKFVFNFNNRVFKHKNKVFNHIITTDGYSIIVDMVNKKINKYEKKKKVINEDNIKDEIKIKTLDEKLRGENEPLNLEDINLTEQEKVQLLKENTLVGCDPGKDDLVTITEDKIEGYTFDNKRKVYKYSSKRWREETLSTYQQRFIKETIKKENLEGVMNELSKESSRINNIEEFNKYIKKREELKEILNKFQEMKFRKLKFQRYTRTQQTEKRIVREIKDVFKEEKKKLLIGYGNWGGNNKMSGYFSTPNKWVRKLLEVDKDIRILIVDEYNTSAITNYTKEKAIHHKYKNEDDELEESYKVITYNIKIKKSIKEKTNSKEEEKVKFFIDRDINGAKNIIECLKEWLINNKRPEALKREEKKEEHKNKAPKRNKQKKRKIIKQSVDLKLCELMLEAKSRNEPNKEKSKKLN